MKEEMTLGDIIEHFAPITPELEDELEKWLPAYIFMIGRQEGWCSYCKSRVEVYPGNQRDGIRARQNEVVQCPACNSLATVKYPKRGFRTLKNSTAVIRYEKSIKNPNVLCARLWHLERHWSKNYPNFTETTPYIAVDSYFLFFPNQKVVRAAPKHSYGVWHYGGYKVSDKTSSRWGVFSKTTERFCDMDSIDFAVSGTSFRYVWEAVRDSLHHSGLDCTALFQQITKYPFATECVAKLIKSGDMCLRMSYTKSIFNWRGKNVNSVFRGRLSKEDKQWLLKCPHDTSSIMRTLQAWQVCQKHEQVYPLEWIDKNIGYAAKEHIAELLRFARLDKIIKYLAEQRKKYPKQRRNDVDLSFYIDYIHQCRELNLNLLDKAVLFPKNLYQRHQEQVLQIKLVAEEETKKKFAKAQKRLQKYNYQNAIYCIVPPASPQELILEGEAMHNCVGSYIDRITKGMTDVVFLRRLKNIDKSFVTIEIRDNKIVQARAKHNKDIEDDGAKMFLEQFTHEVLERMMGV